ncbi:MAG: alpha-amylase family glycosyl hydrolase, partial [Pseudomonadota bacterium]
ARPAMSTEFWEDAIAALPANFTWMAEVYWDMENRLQAMGFNYTYDKRLYDRLCHSHASDIRSHLQADVEYQGRMARFLENHDEPRSAAVFGAHTLTAFATLIATLPGLRFFHQGQLEGRTIHLPMPLNAAAAEKKDTQLEATYANILHIASADVFHDGVWTLLQAQPDSDATHEQLIAYSWRDAAEYRLVVVNLSEWTAQGRLFIADQVETGGGGQDRQCTLDDLLNDASYLRDYDDLLHNGLYVRLDGYSAHVFSISAIN